jgi:hypothetical protein
LLDDLNDLGVEHIENEVWVIEFYDSEYDSLMHSHRTYEETGSHGHLYLKHYYYQYRIEAQQNDGIT